MVLYVKARVIAVLLGRSDTDQVHKDALRYAWRKTCRQGARGQYFSLIDAEATYRQKWTPRQIAAARDVVDDPAIISLQNEDATHAPVPSEG